MSAPDLLPVAVVDDHALVRNALADMIDKLGPYQVVLQAGNGRDYIDSLGTGTHVAVAVMDLQMPVMDGFATIEWIRANTPGTRTLAITFDLTEEFRLRALRAGACGFLRKDAGKAEFLHALDQVARLGRYNNAVPPAAEVSDVIPEPVPYNEDVAIQLSDREVALIRLVCDEAEYTYEQVAERMGVARRTVDGYREALFNKFHIRSKAGLVLFAMRHGLIERGGVG